MKMLFCLLFACLVGQSYTSSALAGPGKPDWYCFDVDPDGEDAETSEVSNVCFESRGVCWEEQTAYYKAYPFSSVSPCERAERVWSFTFSKREHGKYVRYTRTVKNRATCQKERLSYRQDYDNKHVSRCAVSN